jgi:ribonuclease HI
MELIAAINGCIHCLKYMSKHYNEDWNCEVYTDSAYIHNCMAQKWYVNWRRNGWRNAKKEPVKNADLWKELIELTKIHEVTFNKVKGHSDVELNNRCDELARKEAEKFA